MRDIIEHPRSHYRVLNREPPEDSVLGIDGSEGPVSSPLSRFLLVKQ